MIDDRDAKNPTRIPVVALQLGRDRIADLGLASEANAFRCFATGGRRMNFR